MLSKMGAIRAAALSRPRSQGHHPSSAVGRDHSPPLLSGLYKAPGFSPRRNVTWLRPGADAKFVDGARFIDEKIPPSSTRSSGRCTG